MSLPAHSPKPPAASDRRPVGDAAVIMVLFVAILWAVQIVDSVTHYPLLRLGIDPRSFGKIEDIFTAPFIHASFNHLLGNTLPLLVLGFIVALRGIRRFLLITAVIVLISGLGVWLTAASGSDTVGASGVIFGYFGFLVARGFVERRITDILIGVVIGVLYWSILPGLLPDNPGVSWQGHLFGLIGGIAAALLFRRRHDELHATVNAAP